MRKKTGFGTAGLVSLIALAGFTLPTWAADNPFSQPNTGRIMLAEAGANCGGGKCGGEKKGKCGKSEKSAGISVQKGKCGEGKCGSQRIRTMMDKDGNGQIDRKEYVDWATVQANREFDEMAGKDNDSISADEVLENFRQWEAIRDFSS